MGMVFQAEDINLKRMVAIKVLRKRIEGMTESDRVELFLREARSAASLDHPNIAQVYEINQHQGWWYIAMEYLEGSSLHNIVKATGPMEPARACIMLADAARGLAAAHEAGIFHRDIKPANLMLTRRGRCKLVDFGLVKIDDQNDPFHFFDGRLVGTAYYLAPEVIRKQPAKDASDVYSLAATTFAILTGRPPFKAETEKDILKLHVTAQPPLLRQFATGCSANLERLIQSGLAKKPEQRPCASAYAMALQTEVVALAAVDGSGSGNPSITTGTWTLPPSGTRMSMDQSAVPSFTTSASTLPRRRPYTILAAAFASLVILLLGGMQMYHMVRGRDRPGTDAGTAYVNSIGMKLVYIPPGEFDMGSPTTEPDRDDDERHHRVRLTRGFYMSATEITQAQWSRVMGEDYIRVQGLHPNDLNGDRFIGDTMPAYWVSWHEAVEFCKQLSDLDGRTYRLPTEAQWEYACRAETSTAFNTGQTLPADQANVDHYVPGSGNGQGALARMRPMSVASFPPNAWGLYDMHGNVMEWCSNWNAPYEVGLAIDPAGPANDNPHDLLDTRILRGGAWKYPAKIARSANRWFLMPDIKANYIGFRVVMDES